MSYTRRTEPDSDIYLYMDVNGYLQCHNCANAPHGTHHHRTRNTAAMIRHLQQHQHAGDRVPAHVIPDLLNDDRSNFPTNSDR
jgi:hypothetical protein